MSETPTLPTSDEQTSRVLEATNKLYESGDVTLHFERWENEGVSVPPRYEMPEANLDLEREDAFNPTVWDSEDNAVVLDSSAERTEEAKTPLTRAQMYEMMLHSYDDGALLKRLNDITKAAGGIQSLSLN